MLAAMENIRTPAAPAAAHSVCIACGVSSPRAQERCGGCAEPLDVGGRYRLERQLARGEKATTFRARRLEDDALVCLKRFAFDGRGGFEVEEDFQREARILRQLKHPGIPRYLDDFVCGEGASLSLCLVQELVDGADLATELLSHRYTEVEALETLEGLLPVLEYLHGLSPPVIHRDLKPSNVLRGTNGRLFLIDFGSVRDAVLDAESLGEESLGYMPPEQLSGEAVPASDVFALGVLVVVLLTRREPHTLLDAEGHIAWRPAMNHKPETAALLDGLLEHDLTKRAASVGAVRPLLRAALDAARGLVRRPVPSLQPPAPQSKAKPGPAPAGASRSAWPALFTGLLGLAGVGVVVAVAMSSRSSAPESQSTAQNVAPAPSVYVAQPPPEEEARKPAPRRRAAGRRAEVGSVGGSAETKAEASAPPKPQVAAAPPRPSGPPRYAAFPAVLASLRGKTELQRDLFKRDFPGTLLSGHGRITDIARCGAGQSPRWGRRCVEVRLQTDAGRITLAYGDKDEPMTVKLNPGAPHAFSRCAGVSLSTTSARCDMP